MNVPAPVGTPDVLPGVTPAGTSSAATTAPVPRDGQYFLRQQAVFDASVKAITAANGGKTTTLVDAAQKVMDDPKSTVYQIQKASIMVQNAAGLSDATVKRLKDVADSQTAQHTADPLYKLETDPSQMEGAKASAAIALLTNKLSTETDKVQQGRITHLLAQAKNAHAAFIADETSKENARIAAVSGDPAANGQLLAEGDLTLADLKSRGSSPKNITDSVNAAKAYAAAHGKTYNASDEIVGESALKGQTNQNFYGSARSLVQQGGMLDQLKTAHDNLGNIAVPRLNSIAGWLKFNAGTPALAAYKQAVLAAADDYAKVMGGGNPTIEQFNALRDGFAYQLDNAQLDAAVNVARNSVRSQVEGRIGPNQYIRKRMGDILQDEAGGVIKAPTSSSAGKLHTNLTDFKYNRTGPKGTIHSDDGKTWYDQTGKQLGGK
jgi:hypothetical protein